MPTNEQCKVCEICYRFYFGEFSNFIKKYFSFLTFHHQLFIGFLIITLFCLTTLTGLWLEYRNRQLASVRAATLSTLSPMRLSLIPLFQLPISAFLLLKLMLGILQIIFRIGMVLTVLQCFYFRYSRFLRIISYVRLVNDLVSPFQSFLLTVV